MQQDKQRADEEYLNAEVYSGYSEESIYDLLPYLHCYTGAIAVPQPHTMRGIRINAGPSERKEKIVMC